MVHLRLRAKKMQDGGVSVIRSNVVWLHFGFEAEDPDSAAVHAGERVTASASLFLGDGR
jgi:hypothetical protein